MNNRKFFEYSTKSSNINNTFIGFLLIKQLFNCFLKNLFAVILLTVLSSLVAGIAHSEKGITTYSSYKQPTPFDYLEKHKEMPVDFLSSVLYASNELQKKISADNISHPFYELLEYEALTRKPLHYDSESLNHLLSYDDIDKYIDQKLLVSVTNIPVIRWLLQEYSSVNYKDRNNKIRLLTITIEGMLYDLQQRKDSGDAVAARVLDALKHRYVKPSDESGDTLFSLFKWPKSLRQLLSSAGDFSFSGGMMQTDLPHSDQQSRYQRLSALKAKGYYYKKYYTFIGHETDKDGKIVTISSNDIFHTEAEIKKALDDDYSELPNKTSVTTSIAGTKFAGKTANKISAAALSGMFFLSMIRSGATSAIPPRCEAGGDCSTQNYQPLFNDNFTMALKQNPAGHFTLAENITLNAQQALPVSPNCSQPFSGVLSTRNYTIHAESGTSPLFGCIDQAHISGNVNPCSSGTMYTQPVIANQVVNESIVNIQQMEACNRQGPLLGDILGNNNQVDFTSAPGNITIANDAGIIANSVSGNSNVISAEGGHWFDAPVVSVAGGNNNTYQQQNMKITRSAGNYRFDNMFLTADQFSGNQTTVLQNGINVTFNVATAPNFSGQNRNIFNTPNRTVTVLASDTVIKAYTPEESVRLTNISESNEQRSVVINNGRVEIYKNGKWQSLCEDALSERTANVMCRSLEYKEAEPEGRRLLLRGTLSTAQGNSMATYAKECTGNEQHLQQCNTTNITGKICSPGNEAFLSCSNEITRNTTLTDISTDSFSRFDTTNIGMGRLEQRNIFGSERHTVCSTGFTGGSANAACKSMGYISGTFNATRAAPLPESVPILALDWKCTGAETSLLQCAYQNLTHHNCSHNNDVVLFCNRAMESTRLTDRQSIDGSRAVTTNTGLGRFELYFQNSFIPFCNLDATTINNICINLGFASGRQYNLTANPLSLPAHYNFNSVTLNCLSPERCQTRESITRTGHCPNGNNTVILCDDGLTRRPQIQTKYCPQSDKTSGETILFSGKFNPPEMNCEFKQCPLAHWDADGVQHSNFLNQQCSGEQLHTTVPEDWIKVWNSVCQSKQGSCSCHLPNERFLGFVSQSNDLGETLLVSRQAYHDNDNANENGLILVAKLNSSGPPQILQAANETLVETLPVNQIISEKHPTMDQYLLGLYPDAQKNGSSQLFWSSLNPNNNRYHVRTLAVNGEPLLLTKNSVFVKNNQNRTIMQHELNTQIHDLNTVEFDINMSPEIIHFPDHIREIHTAAVGDKWLYVVGTDYDSNQTYVVRYDTLTSSWDPDWRQAHAFNQNTRIFIDTHNQTHFLSPNQISLTTSLSLPGAGGCASFSGEEITEAAPETTMTPIPTMTPEPETETTDNKQSDNKLPLTGVIVATATSVGVVAAASCGCICCYCYVRKSGRKPEQEVKKKNAAGDTEMKSADHTLARNAYITGEPQEIEHIYDTINDTLNEGEKYTQQAVNGDPVGNYGPANIEDVYDEK